MSQVQNEYLDSSIASEVQSNVDVAEGSNMLNTSEVFPNENIQETATANYNEDILNNQPGSNGDLSASVSSINSVVIHSQPTSKPRAAGVELDINSAHREESEEYVIFQVRNKSISLKFFELDENVDKFCVLDNSAVIIKSDLRKSFDIHKWGNCYGGVKKNKGISTMKCQENSACTFVKKKWECVGKCPGYRFCCSYFTKKKQAVNVYLGTHNHTIDKSLLTLAEAKSHSWERNEVNATSGQNRKQVHFDDIGIDENSSRRKSVITRNINCSNYSSVQKEGNLYKECVDQHLMSSSTLGSNIQVNSISHDLSLPSTNTCATSEVEISRVIGTEEVLCKYHTIKILLNMRAGWSTYNC